MADQTFNGKVKFFREDKGYGFIIPNNDPNKEIFFHASAVNTSGKLKEDDAVSFSMGTSKKGECAVDVCKR